MIRRKTRSQYISDRNIHVRVRNSHKITIIDTPQEKLRRLIKILEKL